MITVRIIRKREGEIPSIESRLVDIIVVGLLLFLTGCDESTVFYFFSLPSLLFLVLYCRVDSLGREAANKLFQSAGNIDPRDGRRQAEPREGSQEIRVAVRIARSHVRKEVS